MIGRLQGRILERHAPELLIDVNGVGYEVLAPMSTIYRMEGHTDVVLHTHFAVSETSQQLFGFHSREDRDFFRILIKVNGVGPKMAVGIMSIETGDIVRCVMDSNVGALTKVPGVGKKTAERLIVDLRDKLKGWASNDLGSEGMSHDSSATADNPNAWLAEAEAALTALGYKPAEAARAVSKAMSDEVSSSEELIRRALKSMLPSG
jgi:Holliday junction DNA helicase RuvA